MLDESSALKMRRSMLAILWLRVQRNVASRLSPLSGRPCGDDLSSDDGARCGMDGFFEAGALSGLSTGVPRRFGIDRVCASACRGRANRWVVAAIGAI